MPRRRVERRAHRKVAIGDMRTRLCFLQPRTVAVSGGQQRTLVHLCDAFASEETIVGTNDHAKVNLKSEATTIEAATHKWTMRFNPDIKAELIVERGGKRFKILEIQDLDGRREYLRLRARELGADDKEATKI